MAKTKQSVRRMRSFLPSRKPTPCSRPRDDEDVLDVEAADVALPIRQDSVPRVADSAVGDGAADAADEDGGTARFVLRPGAREVDPAQRGAGAEAERGTVTVGVEDRREGVNVGGPRADLGAAKAEVLQRDGLGDPVGAARDVDMAAGGLALGDRSEEGLGVVGLPVADRAVIADGDEVGGSEEGCEGG
jgi:hypothetical protein